MPLSYFSAGTVIGDSPRPASGMSDFGGQISYYNLPSDTEGEPASTESAKAAPKPSGESDIKSAEAPAANESEAKPAAPVSDPEKPSKQAVESASDSVQSVVTKSDEKPLEEKPTEAEVKSELSAAKTPAPDKVKPPEPSGTVTVSKASEPKCVKVTVDDDGESTISEIPAVFAASAGNAAGLATYSIIFCFLFVKNH